MKLTVFGASGGIGTALVRRGLDAGGRNVRGGFTIARTDVADYLLGAVRADELVGATVSVAG